MGDQSRVGAIPGVDMLLEGQALPQGSMLLLTGPSGTGKTTYCQQFLSDGLAAGEHCIWISSSMTDKEFAGMFSFRTSRPPQFVSLRPSSTFANDAEWAASLRSMLTELRANVKSDRQPGIRMVLDSLTQLKLLVKEEMLLKFLADLSFVAKEAGATVIITLNETEDDRMRAKAGAICDGILELRVDEIDGRLNRSARLTHIRGVSHIPVWANFGIEKDGSLAFGEQPVPGSIFSCVLCGKPIAGAPVMEENFAFDTNTCAETYRKLTKIYGANISEIGLPSEAVNVSFFFVDIVGLSDPSLSVRKQIEKIRALNEFVASTEAFKKSEDKRFILPTGDGMAIGFLLNSELPLKLSIELHRKLAAHNKNRPAEDRIGVRIGLNSGPVFVVGDITNNQNVWGPGIILARRVMDLGDNGHILLGEKIAEDLMSSNEKYKDIIKLVSGNFQIKHGQVIKVYSAHSDDFGNSALPLRLS